MTTANDEPTITIKDEHHKRTLTMTHAAVKRQAAEHALGARACPQITDERVRILAKHLTVIDGKAVVVDAAGVPRTTDDLLGTGIQHAYPLTRLIDDLQGDPAFGWSR